MEQEELTPSEVATLEQYLHDNGYPNLADAVPELAKLPGQRLQLGDTHDCLDHLVMRSGSVIEATGEIFWDEWSECRICHATYTDAEVSAMWEKESASSGVPGLTVG